MRLFVCVVFASLLSCSAFCVCDCLVCFCCSVVLVLCSFPCYCFAWFVSVCLCYLWFVWLALCLWSLCCVVFVSHLSCSALFSCVLDVLLCCLTCFVCVYVVLGSFSLVLLVCVCLLLFWWLICVVFVSFVVVLPFRVRVYVAVFC